MTQSNNTRIGVRAVSDFSGVSTRRLREGLCDKGLVAVVTGLEAMGGVQLRPNR